MSKYRILGIIVLLILILFLPYWIYVPALFAAIVVFHFFWEAIILSFLIDTLYGPGISSFYSILSSFSFWSLLILIIILPVRRHIRAYA